MWGKSIYVKNGNDVGYVYIGYIGVMERCLSGNTGTVYLTESGNGTESKAGNFHIETSLEACNNRGCYSLFDTPQDVIKAYNVLCSRSNDTYKLVGVTKMTVKNISTFERINFQFTL